MEMLDKIADSPYTSSVLWLVAMVQQVDTVYRLELTLVIVT